MLLTFASCFINHEEIFEKTDFTCTVKQHSGADQGTLMHFAIQESGKFAENFKARILKIRCLKYMLIILSTMKI